MRIIIWLLLFLGITQDLSTQSYAKQKTLSQEEELVKKAEKLKEKIKTMRELSFSQKTKVGAYTKKQLQEFLLKEVSTELPEKNAKKIEKIGQHFGVLNKDFKTLDSLIDMLSNNVAGFYHPRTKELRLIDNMEDMYILHELIHAAQDQNFDLRTLKAVDVENDDLIMAIDSLIEGDASVVQWRFQLGDSFDRMKNQLSNRELMAKGLGEKYPRLLKESLILPYTDGYTFVLKAVEDKGWDIINKMFNDPPLSTEQIFHPEKYLGKERDYPTEIKLPIIAMNKSLGKDYTRLATNVWGEFGIQVIFSEFKTPKKLKAAAGWDGDTYTVWERKDGRTVSVWYSTWDSDADTDDFFDAIKHVIEKKYSVSDPEEEGKTLYYETKENGKVLLQKLEKDVLVIEGLDTKGDLKSLRKIITQGVKKQEIKKFERPKLIII